jgi:tRNA (guanine37-N1)-methyltransferase
MRFHVLTLFPEAFGQPLQFSIVGRAVQRGQVSIDATDIRDYAHDVHGTADDYQFGGGHGMVMKPGPVFEAVEAALAGYSESQRADIPVILFTPQGELLTQPLVEELAAVTALALVCGHYAGVDERVSQALVTRQVSIGDYVLTGGELPAMVLIDAVSRLLPGVVGSPESVTEDSFSISAPPPGTGTGGAGGLLQHPLYTRPADYRGMAVPEVLLSGHHAEIDRWRRRQSLKRTLDRRPDLLRSAELSADDRKYLTELGYTAGDTS